MNTIRIQFLFSIVIVSLLLLSACADEQGSVPDMDTTTAGTETDTTAMQPDAATQKINLNTATAEEFQTIPNVGEQMVGEFIEYRPYVSIRQFRQEMGKYVDEEQVAGYEEYVFVPVDPNESDEATLQQLPGVDASIAAELVAGRPYESNDAFLEALDAHVTPQQRDQAEMYLGQE